MPQVVRHRYWVVLGLILLTLAFQLAAPEGNAAQMVAVTLQAATLIAAVITADAHRWVVRVTVAACGLLVVAAAGTVLGTEEFGGDAARLISLLLVSLAPPVIILGLRQHFDEGGVTLQTMFGVLCLYLLIGMLFGSLYGVIDSLTSREFFISDDAKDISDFLYFSFSTLTTTGYGDLVAATDVGRSLAITEALIGQIYLVTVVALIVSQVGLRRASSDA